MNTQKDSLHHFLFENTPIRGNLVHLSDTYNAALAHQQLPLVVKKALGELMAASALLISTLKMNGALVLQIQTKGQLKLLVVECSSDLEMRATAKWEGEIADDADFLTLIKEGHCIITLDTKNSEPYQGIVPIEGVSIAEMLENYMLRSQQIDTKLWLSCDGNSAAGLLIQKLPEQEAQDADAWNRVTILADTVTEQELQTESAERILTTLFYEEDVRLFEANSVRFYCQCTRENVGKMLQMLGQDEVESILSEQEKIEINCDFCNKQYLFDAVDAATLFTENEVINASKAIH
ncbi:MAG: Hsp33 family molecular chaperone HslO [Betaproteobacteria bacterium]|nr:Hsp33 family molecular chaperone HslO [Betaproteobacteria bacterium]MCH9848798.1 Hsp33 family molecular chaperone HslO [Betaproteobacteria bacterium]